jgi:hypothetical protein
MVFQDYIIVTLLNVFLTFLLGSAKDWNNNRKAKNKEQEEQVVKLQTDLTAETLKSTIALALKEQLLPIDNKLTSLNSKIDKLTNKVNELIIGLNKLLPERFQIKPIKQTSK